MSIDPTSASTASAQESPASFTDPSPLMPPIRGVRQPSEPPAKEVARALAFISGLPMAEEIVSTPHPALGADGKPVEDLHNSINNFPKQVGERAAGREIPARNFVDEDETLTQKILRAKDQKHFKFDKKLTPHIVSLDITNPEQNQKYEEILNKLGDPRNKMTLLEPEQTHTFIDATAPMGFRTIVVVRWAEWEQVIVSKKGGPAMSEMDSNNGKLPAREG